MAAMRCHVPPQITCFKPGVALSVVVAMLSAGTLTSKVPLVQHRSHQGLRCRTCADALRFLHCAVRADGTPFLWVTVIGHWGYHPGQLRYWFTMGGMNGNGTNHHLRHGW